MKTMCTCLLVVLIVACAQSPGQTFLKGWEGTWNGEVGYIETGRMRFAVAPGIHVDRVGDDYAFTVHSADRHFEGSLKAAGNDRYLLNITSGDDAIVDLPLEYSPEGLLVGMGVFRGKPVEASLRRTKGSYGIVIVDPAAPKDNNWVLNLEFSDRE